MRFSPKHIRCDVRSVPGVGVHPGGCPGATGRDILSRQVLGTRRPVLDLRAGAVRRVDVRGGEHDERQGPRRPGPDRGGGWVHRKRG